MGGPFQQPLVTIGLPVYNAGRFLVGALQSVFAQTCEDWELIVVDDGSTDNAWPVVEQLSDPRVRAMRDGVHRGLAVRLNQIGELARGKFIARMDADDMCHPERIERQIRYLEEHPSIDAVSTSLAVLDRHDRFAGWRAAHPDHAVICAHPLKGFGFVHAATLARTDWARRNRYNEHNPRCEDWELLSRTWRASRFANLTECLYFYREYDSFTMGKYARSKVNQSAAEIRQGGDYGVPAVAWSALRHLSHVAMYAAASAVSMQDLLIAARSLALPDELSAQLADAKRRVEATRLPGSARVNIVRNPLYFPTPAPSN